MAGLMFMAYQQALDGNGNPYSGAKLYFYAAGTTTPLDTYTDYALGTPNANPVVADASGRFGGIWFGAALYKAVLKTSADVTIWTVDYIGGPLMDILTTRGDLLTRDATGYKRLAKGTAGQALLADANDVVWGAVPSLTAANTWTANQTLQSADGGSAFGPALILDRNSGSPAAADVLGIVFFAGRDSNGNSLNYGFIQGEIVDPVDGTEDGRISFGTAVNGGTFNRWYMGYGLYPFGLTDQGDGTINAKGYFVNGVAFPVTKSFTSAEQTIAAAGSRSLTHGLGAAPSIVQCTLVCKVADNGYSIGDVILVGSSTAWDDAGGSGYPMGMSLNATTIEIRYGDNAQPFRYVHKTTGAGVKLTNNSWRLVVRAFA